MRLWLWLKDPGPSDSHDHGTSGDTSHGLRLRRVSSALEALLVNKMLLKEALLAGCCLPSLAPAHHGGRGPDIITWLPPLLSAPSRLLPKPLFYIQSFN